MYVQYQSHQWVILHTGMSHVTYYNEGRPRVESLLVSDSNPPWILKSWAASSYWRFIFLSVCNAICSSSTAVLIGGCSPDTVMICSMQEEHARMRHVTLWYKMNEFVPKVHPSVREYTYIYTYVYTYLYFYLCIGVRIHAYVYVCACMRACVHVHMYVYAYMCVCVYVCIYMYIHMCVDVYIHSYRRIFLICAVQSLYYMRVYQWCLFNACLRV